jgi:hypothetical protein
MPGFDGTGPRGEGPMTGWGMGYCAQPVEGRSAYPSGDAPAYPPIPPGFGGRGRRFGWGRGFGRGCGWGRGFGRGWGFRGGFGW